MKLFSSALLLLATTVVTTAGVGWDSCSCVYQQSEQPIRDEPAINNLACTYIAAVDHSGLLQYPLGGHAPTVGTELSHADTKTLMKAGRSRLRGKLSSLYSSHQPTPPTNPLAQRKPPNLFLEYRNYEGHEGMWCTTGRIKTVLQIDRDEYIKGCQLTTGLEQACCVRMDKMVALDPTRAVSHVLVTSKDCPGPPPPYPDGQEVRPDN